MQKNCTLIAGLEKAWGVEMVESIAKDKDVHVVPVFFGEPVHDETSDCWCEPEMVYWDEINGSKVWAHRRPE